MLFDHLHQLALLLGSRLLADGLEVRLEHRDGQLAEGACLEVVQNRVCVNIGRLCLDSLGRPIRRGLELKLYAKEY